MTRPWVLCTAALALPVLVAGCLGKRESYNLPAVELPETYRHAPAGVEVASRATPETAPRTVPQAVSKWWRFFGNAELNRLVEEALANNYGLKAAIHRITQAQMLAGVEHADEWPEISASGDYEIEKPEGGIGTVEPGASRTSRRSQHLYQVGLLANYEVDLWGKNRAKTEAALERAWASVFARETVALTLTADVVQNFIEYLSLQDRIANADWTRGTLSNMEQAVRERVEGGEATNIQLAQQRAAVANSKSVIPVLELQRDQRINAIALLVGKSPSEIRIKSSSLSDITFPTVMPGVPSRLLLRRPDIREAEANLIAADADIDTARAELFPTIDLTAEVGYGARHLAFLFEPTSLFWTAAASATQIIFDAGRRRSQIAFNEAVHAELVQTYMQSIYTAIRETEDALVAIRYLGLRRSTQNEAVVAAREAYQFSQEGYKIGATDYLTLLDTERTLFTETDELHRVDFDRFQAAVDLFRALGGSMQPEDVLVASAVDSTKTSRPPGYFEDEPARRPIGEIVPNLPAAGFWVHVASTWSKHAAWRHWRRMKGRSPDLFGQIDPVIERQEPGDDKGAWFSILVGPYAARPGADQLCGAIRTKGGGCQVMAR